MMDERNTLYWLVSVAAAGRKTVRTLLENVQPLSDLFSLGQEDLALLGIPEDLRLLLGDPEKAEADAGRSLERDRALLYARIDARVDAMMEAGLLEETERLRAEGLKEGMTAAHGLGYRELLRYLEGECTLEEAVRLIKQNTRHYAKRQLTWFRREPDVIRLDADRFTDGELLGQIQKILMGKKILL